MPNALIEKPAAGSVMGHNQPPRVADVLAAYLVETYGADLLTVDPIAQRATEAPGAITTDEELATWSGIYNDAKAAFDRLEKARLDEARPLKKIIDEFFKNSVARLDRMQTVARDLSNKYNRAKVAREAEERRKIEQQRLDGIRAAEEAARIAAEFDEPEKAAAAVEQATELKIEAAVAATEAPKPTAAMATEFDGGGSVAGRMIWKFEVEDYDKIDLAKLRTFIKTSDIDVWIGKYMRLQKENAKLDGVRFFQEADTVFKR